MKDRYYIAIDKDKYYFGKCRRVYKVTGDDVFIYDPLSATPPWDILNYLFGTYIDSAKWPDEKWVKEGYLPISKEDLFLELL